jgi:hypothetical protein
MLSPLRNRFGIPGVISVIALVFAMFGGAYAATNDSSGGGKAAASAGKANASAKAKRGPRGPKGPAGPAGPAGAKGDAGAAGANGKDGANGSNGSNGASVTSTEFTGAQGPCSEGGTKFTVGAGAPSYACNGEEGPEGEEGDPWTDGETLPPGATETGVWTATGDFAGTPQQAEETTTYYPIGFSIPLASPPTFVAVKGNSDGAAGCDGIVDGVPTADPGKLCVYLQNEFAESAFTFAAVDPTADVVPLPSGGTSRAGILLQVTCAAEALCVPASGTWAVTG